MSDVPPEGADPREWLKRRRNTRINLRIARVGVVLAMISGAVVLMTSDAVGFYIRPPGFRGGFLTWDFWNSGLVMVWALSLIPLSAHDESHYRPLFGRRFRRSRSMDLVIPIVYIGGAALWGEFVFRPILEGRTTVSKYVAHQAGGTAALEAGIPVVMISYYVSLSVVFAIYLIGLHYNPVDLDLYEQMGGRVRRWFGSPRKRS